MAVYGLLGTASQKIALGIIYKLTYSALEKLRCLNGILVV